jgi:DNA polymerase III sliding clamp (beta) subunit (PCNA family)
MPISVFVNADVFRVALTRVAACSSATNLVRMSITSNNIHLLSQDLDYSVSGEENVECTLNGSEGLEFGINANLMLSILGAMNSVNEVEIKMLDATRPILVLPVTQNEGSELTMLLTPMTL